MMHDTPQPGPARLVALDWGTSALRAWLLGDDGQILDARECDGGLLRVEDYAATFSDVCSDWLGAHPDVPAIACGMVGSSQGWREAGYLTVPTDLTIAASALTPVPHDRGILHLVPGLRYEHDGRTDVMRGEETQLIGVLRMLDADDLLVVLPGTHTKWVRISAHQVLSFTTAMTGELYGLLMQHGILARTAAAAAPDEGAFARGLAADPSRGLASALFGARAAVLDDQLAPSALPDYVSGLLIADEVRHLLPEHLPQQRIVLCGNAELCRRYSTAFAAHGVTPAASITGDAAALGLWTIAADCGLISPTRHSEEVS
ncbi:2-dehydro-3-deoxygalactonokinase [Mycolicibacterium mageritense]